MKILITESSRRIKENKEILEKKFKVKIFIKGRQVSIEGEEVDEFVGEKALEAINLGFDIETTFLLLEPDCLLEKVEIKNLTQRTNLKEVRARLIGKQGRTKQLIEELSECYISIHDSEVGVIGQSDRIKNCIQAVTKIIQGSKQSSVYAYLERQRTIIHPSDLGLK